MRRARAPSRRLDRAFGVRARHERCGDCVERRHQLRLSRAQRAPQIADRRAGIFRYDAAQIQRDDGGRKQQPRRRGKIAFSSSRRRAFVEFARVARSAQRFDGRRAAPVDLKLGQQSDDHENQHQHGETDEDVADGHGAGRPDMDSVVERIP